MIALKVRGTPVGRAAASAAGPTSTHRVMCTLRKLARPLSLPTGLAVITAIAGMALLPVSMAHAQGTASQAAAVPSLGGAGIVQTGFGLVLVLALLFGLAWLAKRFGLQRPLGGSNVRIVGSAAVGQRERVVVVEVAGDWVVLGVAPGQVRSLHVIDADRVADHVAESPAPAVAHPGAQANRAAQAFAQKLRETMKKDT
ncbi:flagellar biosynthetic protein FliO [Pandoraea aquatica]|uniref:Flagellar protein n=1 Tax=Pandoraea aquatica TaxID=2508290 RepID=A0A5E4YQN0_9BURK|nr:flagellar biosynthetic protein FliO [Pandoraea aquatica]VVE51139.1 flagellar biosynthetic protein FliO [Pandoraea aquatica]